MKNYVSSDRVIALLFVLTGAALGSICPIAVLLHEREQSQQILEETVTAIRRQLPSHTNADFTKQIPYKINHHLRLGVRYYPQRDAYKYTFRPKYTYDHKGEISMDTGFPEPLERRSIWWKMIDGEWKCYAGVKKHIRGQLCNEYSIIRGLSVQEHNTAWHINDCSNIVFWLRSLNLAYNTHVYVLSNRAGKDGYARINADGQEVLLILESERKLQDWYISYTPETKIRAVIWDNKGIESTVYGLPPDLPVFDYAKAGERCRSDLSIDGYIVSHMAGIFDPTIVRESIYKESDNIIKIGRQENQQWQSSSTSVKGAFNAMPPVEVEAKLNQTDSSILNKTKGK